jgi:hypothetical protein
MFLYYFSPAGTTENRHILMLASKVFCPLDSEALAVLPHGQIVGFAAFFGLFAVASIMKSRQRDQLQMAGTWR